MAKADSTSRQFARLSFEDGEVVVTPKDRSIFLISAEKATEACRTVVRMEERFKRFESELLVPLHEFCITHSDRVRACYIPLPVGHMQVFVVTNAPEFDFELGEKIAELELRLARSGWRVGVTQLPDADDESLATFFKPDGALEINAERGPTPQESGK